MPFVSNHVKRLTEPLGFDQALRKLYVETALLGEKVKFSVTGRPVPSTAIIVAGSGRSGTTWLEEVLSTLPGMQPIFEPLHPRFNPEVRRLTGYDTESQYSSSWYLPPNDESTAWTELLKNVLTGQLRNYWTDYVRKSYLPNCYLIKEIRANLMLGYLYQRFQPRIVYMLRHPCAVVNSRLVAGWHADVQDVLTQPRLVDDYCNSYKEEMLQEKDRLGAHAVWWAVENHVALTQLQQIPHFLIYYEQMVMQPQQVLNKLLFWLGYPNTTHKLIKNISLPSRMGHSSFQYKNAQAQLSQWQTLLSPIDRQRVLAWARHFGLSMYNEHYLPIHLQSNTEVR